jgi:hypothetical protein
MKNIFILLPYCAIVFIGQKEFNATIIVSLEEVTTTKSMPTTWKKNTFALLPTCVIVLLHHHRQIMQLL